VLAVIAYFVGGPQLVMSLFSGGGAAQQGEAPVQPGAPTDEAGNPVGNVLHVGTGLARMMVVTANTCDGPKAYVGLASSYFEDLTTGLKRLDDPTWDTALTSATPPADVSWMSDLVTH